MNSLNFIYSEYFLFQKPERSDHPTFFSGMESDVTKLSLVTYGQSLSGSHDCKRYPMCVQGIKEEHGVPNK